GGPARTRAPRARSPSAHVEALDHAPRQGHELLLGVHADEVDSAFDELLRPPRAEHVLLEADAVLALAMRDRVDLEPIAEDGALAVGELGPVDDEADALVPIERDELVDAEEVLARALEVLEVVRVVD